MNLDLQNIVKKPSYSLCYDPMQKKWLLTSVYPSGHDRQDYIDVAAAKWYQSIGAKNTTTPGVWIPFHANVFEMTPSYRTMEIV